MSGKAPIVVKVTVSPQCLFHRVHPSGIDTFCGLDLSIPSRQHWEIWEAEPPEYSKCQRCWRRRRRG